MVPAMHDVVNHGRGIHCSSVSFSITAPQRCLRRPGPTLAIAPQPDLVARMNSTGSRPRTLEVRMSVWEHMWATAALLC